METEEGIRSLTRQRNVLAIGAIVVLFGTLAISLPRAMARRSELKTAHDTILRLQSDLLVTQQREREVMANIVRAQAEIKAIQSKARE